MSAHHPTAPAKPSKPRPGYLLFPHLMRRWAKKIHGNLHYFGPWNEQMQRSAITMLKRRCSTQV